MLVSKDFQLCIQRMHRKVDSKLLQRLMAAHRDMGEGQGNEVCLGSVNIKFAFPFLSFLL